MPRPAALGEVRASTSRTLRGCVRRDRAARDGLTKPILWTYPSADPALAGVLDWTAELPDPQRTARFRDRARRGTRPDLLVVLRSSEFAEEDHRDPDLPLPTPLPKATSRRPPGSGLFYTASGVRLATRAAGSSAFPLFQVHERTSAEGSGFRAREAPAAARDRDGDRQIRARRVTADHLDAVRAREARGVPVMRSPVDGARMVAHNEAAAIE